MDFPSGGEIMEDVENNYIGGENNDEENRIERSEEGSDEVKAHGWCLLPKRTYDSIKEKEDESWREIIDDQTLKQKSPGGNTVLHIAALYGNDRCVERILEIGPAELLIALNNNGDTPLHVAARAGKISTLHKLVAPLLRNLNSQQAKMVILVINKQRNTLFHEALLNGHKNVMEILDSSPPGFRKLVELEVFACTNYQDKSVLQLAFERGYEDIVDDGLTRIIPRMEEPEPEFFPEIPKGFAFGHIEVLKKLLENCPDPGEIVDNKGRNIVHIAAIMGEFNVVRYVLQDAKDEVKDMINGKDCDGNTPLHLAASHSRPKIVQALTWDTRVDLHCLNNNNQTTLDVFEQFKQENNPPFSRARGFTLHGGNDSSSPEKQGMVAMLNRMWFKLFILCITISMYGGISVTIILLWAQLEDITLALLALKVAMPLLGVTLATLSVAFLVGVHLVISDLGWLATTRSILCVVFILLAFVTRTLFSRFPSKSSNLIMRYISFYPFRLLTWLIEDSSEGR
ncbi:hypothetical protein ACSQ67_010027 [Phaseolus vulgaris]